ncbi:MAG: hypothetical protein Q9225_002751 [Loekoesia sp. 1 TL-2023]
MLFPRPASLLWLLAACIGVYAAIEADPSNIRTIPLRSHSLSAVGLPVIEFPIEVEFKIHGQGNLHGDGMAIWITKQRGQTGPVFGSVDQFEGLGVFIDTYKNQRPGVVFPYVMAMLGNASVSYDKDHDGKDNEIAGCSVCFLLLLLPFPLSSLTSRSSQKLTTNSFTTKTGPRHPLLLHPHENPPHLLRRKIPNRRSPIQIRKRMDRMLRDWSLDLTLCRLPRLLRRNGRAER